jgi:ATP-dependent protease Clp ATPase subunit
MIWRKPKEGIVFIDETINLLVKATIHRLRAERRFGGIKALLKLPEGTKNVPPKGGQTPRPEIVEVNNKTFCLSQVVL